VRRLTGDVITKKPISLRVQPFLACMWRKIPRSHWICGGVFVTFMVGQNLLKHGWSATLEPQRLC
jgi:hypothetical protein